MKKALLIVKTFQLECSNCGWALINEKVPYAGFNMWTPEQFIEHATVTCNHCDTELDIPMTGRIRDRLIT